MKKSENLFLFERNYWSYFYAFSAESWDHLMNELTNGSKNGQKENSYVKVL